ALCRDSATRCGTNGSSTRLGILPSDRIRQSTLIGDELDDHLPELVESQSTARRESRLRGLLQRGRLRIAHAVDKLLVAGIEQVAVLAVHLRLERRVVLVRAECRRPRVVARQRIDQYVDLLGVTERQFLLFAPDGDVGLVRSLL